MSSGSESAMGIIMLAVVLFLVGAGAYNGATNYDMHWFFGIICGGFVGLLLGFLVMAIMAFFAFDPTKR